jgi:V/A-type H+-transporting ATPase subunit K
MTGRIGLAVAVVAAGLLAMSALAMAAEGPAGETTQEQMPYKAVGLGFAGAIAIIGSAYAVARVGSAACGTIAERPEVFVRALMFVALAEGLGVLAFALAILLYIM